ncbi:tyrosine-type recombinase/integrase [Nocardia sp. NPDC058499]|uniref:tyrosine-type recombinase/integrase n=1 Tax=Nocardia sp. NPDC058499 TaxID=3346530 RepID=UPI00364C5444
MAEVERLVFVGLGAPLLEAFRGALSGMSLAAKTRVTYLERVNDFVRWWRGSGGFDDAFTGRRGRDAAVGAYCEDLERRGVEPSTVNVSLAALDTFYRWVGLGPVQLPRAVLAQIVPDTLDVRQRSRLLAAASQRGLRDYALVTLALDTGLLESELAALDVGDLCLDEMAEHGQVRVRGRTVPLGAGCRAVLMLWCADRRTRLGGDLPGPLFITEDRRRRVAVRTVDHIIRSAGRDAGMEISPGTLRNTCEQQLRRSGLSAAKVDALMGRRWPNPARDRAMGPSAQLSFDLSA